MVLAVDELDAHLLNRRARELTVLHRLLDPLVHRGAIALRDHAADDPVDELVALMPLDRLEHDLRSRRTAPARRSASCSGGGRATPSGSSRGTGRAAGGARRRRRARFARSSATSTCIWLIPARISSPVC